MSELRLEDIKLRLGKGGSGRGVRARRLKMIWRMSQNFFLQRRGRLPLSIILLFLWWRRKIADDGVCDLTQPLAR
jgi:hypothetical protein